MTDIIALPTTALYIGGEQREGTSTLAVADPAKRGVTVGFAAAASEQDAADAVAAAKAAFPAWSALTRFIRRSGRQAPLDAVRALLGELRAHVAGDLADDAVVVCLDWTGPKVDGQ